MLSYNKVQNPTYSSRVKFLPSTGGEMVLKINVSTSKDKQKHSPNDHSMTTVQQVLETKLSN